MGTTYLIETKIFFVESIKKKVKSYLNSIMRPMNNTKKYNEIYE